jgi:prophage regulatory protein
MPRTAVTTTRRKPAAKAKPEKVLPFHAPLQPVPSLQPAMHASHQPPRLLLTKKEVLALVPFSYPTIWKRIRAGTFPRGREASPGKIFWFADEIENWARQLPTQKLKGDADATAAEMESEPA